MGKTGHYLTLDLTCDNKQLAISPLPIRMPNGEIITSTHISLLSKKYLPIEARKTHLFPGTNKALLSIRKFCDHGCQAIFYDKKKIILNKGSGKVIMEGKVDPHSNLYMINLTQQNKIMTEFPTPEMFLRGLCMSANKKAHLWITTTHHSGSPINPGG